MRAERVTGCYSVTFKCDYDCDVLCGVVLCWLIVAALRNGRWTPSIVLPIKSVRPPSPISEPHLARQTLLFSTAGSQTRWAVGHPNVEHFERLPLTFFGALRPRVGGVAMAVGA